MAMCVKVIVAIAFLGLATGRTYNGVHEHIHGYGKHKFDYENFDHGFEFHDNGRWPLNFHSHGEYQPNPYGYHQPRDYDIHDEENWTNDFVRWDPDWVFPDEDRLSDPWTSITSSTTANPVSSTSLAVKLCLGTCQVTPEYNPVCGTDNVTYSNPGKLECAKYCGVDVELKRTSPCMKPDPTKPPAPNPLSVDQSPITDESTKRTNDLGSTIPNDVLACILTTTEESPDIDIRFPEKESTPS